MSTADASIEYDRSEPVVIVSNDTHIGPRLVEDLRAYCPTKHLDEFDRFAADDDSDEGRCHRDAAGQRPPRPSELPHPRTPRLGSTARRLRPRRHRCRCHLPRLDEPGADPVHRLRLGKPTTYGDHELVGVGMQIYNRWLADFVSEAPHRHIGLAYLPMWDVDAAVAEIEWARDAGLRGVNFPAMRDGALPEYNRKLWEPLWSVCEELRMPLVTHVGGATNARYSGLEGVALLQYESGGFTSRRAVWWLILAGVFERHPDLKLVITETPGNWFPHGRGARRPLGLLRRQAGRAAQQGAPRTGATTAERVHGAERVLRRQLRLAVRGRTGRAARHRLPAPVGLGLPPPRRHLREPRGRRHALGDAAVLAPHLLRRLPPRHAGWWARTPSTSTASTRPPSRRSPTGSAHRRSTIWPRRSTRSPRGQPHRLPPGAGGWG